MEFECPIEILNVVKKFKNLKEKPAKINYQARIVQSKINQLNILLNLHAPSQKNVKLCTKEIIIIKTTSKQTNKTKKPLISSKLTVTYITMYKKIKLKQ